MKRAATLGTTLMMTAMTLLALPQAANAAHTQTGLCREIDVKTAVGTGLARAVYVDQSVTGTVEWGKKENTQQGPGTSTVADDNSPLEVPGVVRANLLDTEVTGNVTAEPLVATQDSRLELANVTILDGLVSASLLRSQAETFTREKAAFTDSDGTTFGWVVVDGNRYTDIGPNTIIPLNDTVFGERSKVILFERVDDSRFPSTEHPFYTAELSVRMIHVIITDLQPQVIGQQRLEVIVAETYAFSKVPTPWCGPHQNVGASAYVGRFRDEQSFGDPGILVGWLELPPTGGQANQSVQAPSIQEGDVNISMGHAETRVFGEVDIGERSKSWSVSKVEDLCIRTPTSDDCLVSAGVIRVESQSRAFSDDRYSWAHVRITDLFVNGENITAHACPGQEVCNPPRNYEQKVGEYKVILNMRQRDPLSDGHTGYTARAVWVEGPGLGIHIIGRAYSEAYYEPGA